MKYTGEKKEKNGGEKYLFEVGIEEVRVMKIIFAHYRKNIPDCFDTKPLFNRVKNFEKTLNEVK